MCIVSDRSKACLFHFMHLTGFNSLLPWQYFETDDPEFYKTKVCFILNNDVSEMDLVFAEEKYSKSGQLEKVIHPHPNYFALCWHLEFSAILNKCSCSHINTGCQDGKENYVLKGYMDTAL